MKRFSKSKKLIPAPKLIFFILLFFLPQQFGPHFWPQFSYVHGIRVDYLSPSIFISDVLLIVLFLVSFGNVLRSTLSQKFFRSRFFLLFLFVSVISLFSAASPIALLYGLFKWTEIGYLGLFIATQLKKQDIPLMIGVFTLEGVLESAVAVIQFFKQNSIGGVFYYLGERTFNLSTIGIATMNTTNGLMLRPYGTFPHPNVLAFFLFAVIVLVTYRVKLERNKKVKKLLIFSFAFMQLSLLLTFSRIIILLNIIFLLYVFLYRPIKEKIISGKKVTAVIIFAIFFIVYFLLNTLRFFDLNYLTKDLTPRAELVQVSLTSLKNYPIFGLGLNNYFYYQADLQKHFSSIYLQPVHNIFLLIAVQVGVVGVLLFGYFLSISIVNLVKSIKKSNDNFTFSETVLILLLSIIIAGMFDHYFLTTQQGQLMLTIILGLSWSRAMV